MIIGLDFDNTIVSYDELFFKVAREQGVVPADTPPTKVAVRDYLRSVDRESVWTEMQGYVYGARMKEAAAYPGVLEFLRWASNANHVVAIVSHKTKYPFLGVHFTRMTNGAREVGPNAVLALKREGYKNTDESWIPETSLVL